MVKLVVELVYKGNRNRISRYLRSNLGLCRKTLVKGFRYRRSKERKRRARKLALKAFKARGFPKHLFQKLRRRLNNKLARILYKKKRGFECNVWKFSQLIRWWKRKVMKLRCFDVNTSMHVKEIMADNSELFNYKDKNIVEVSNVDRNNIHVSDESFTGLASGVNSVVMNSQVDGAVSVSTLKVSSLNANSLHNYARRVNLVNLLGNTNDLVFLQETNCNSNGIAQVDNVLSWKFFHFDRGDAKNSIRGGGTGFLVNPKLHAELVGDDDGYYRDGERGVEWCWIRVRGNSGWLYCCSVYNPPHLVPPDETMNRLKRLINIFSNRDDFIGIIMAGDFNSFLLGHHHAERFQPSNLHQRIGNRWRSAIFNNEFRYSWQLLNTLDCRPTCISIRGGAAGQVSRSVLDYCWFLGPSNSCRRFEVKDLSLQHQLLYAEFNANSVRQSLPEYIKFSNLKGDKLVNLKNQLQSMNLEEVEDYDDWFNHLKNSLIECLGTGRKRWLYRFRECKWWTEDLSILSSKIKRLSRARYRSKYNRKIKRISEKITKLRKSLLRLIARKRRQYSVEIRKSWSVSDMSNGYKAMKKAGSKRYGTIKHNRATMEEEWGNVFSTLPPDSCRNNADEVYISNYDWNFEVAESDKITIDEIKSAIRCIKTKKAAGLDGIPNEIIKILPHNHIEWLCQYFNIILADPTKIPDAWFKSSVILLPKKEDPGPLDFRPITLLSCIAKLMEQILWNRVKVLDVGLHENQFGFKAGLDGLMQAHKFFMCCEGLRATKRSAVALFLDLQKAFDSVPHSILIY